MKFTNLLIGFFAVILSVSANAQSLFTQNELNQIMVNVENGYKNSFDGFYSNGLIVNQTKDTSMTDKVGYIGTVNVERTIPSLDLGSGQIQYNIMAKKISVHIFDGSVVDINGGTSNYSDGAIKFKTFGAFVDVKEVFINESGYSDYNSVRMEEIWQVNNILNSSLVDSSLSSGGTIYSTVYLDQSAYIQFLSISSQPIDYTGVTQDCANPDTANTSNSSVCLIGQVLEGCKLSAGNYYTSINSVAGNVGLTAVDLKITCSTGMPYHLKPIHDNIQLAGTDETLRLTGWKDSGRGDKLTPLSAKVINGTGSEQSITIYFTLEGKGRSGLYGNSVVNKYNGSAVYPIQINY